MIKPSEVTAVLPVPQGELDALEEQFDKAILEAERTGKWPAVVHTARDLATPSGIRVTIDRYRAADWVVVEGPGVRARLYHPDQVAREERRVGSMVLG